MRRPNVLLLGGSHDRPSHTSALLRYAEHSLTLGGAAAHRWDLADRPLPSLRPLRGLEREVRGLVAAAFSADAVVIATPLYHGSYSGAVKDALDHLSTRELEGKPVALLSHSGNSRNMQALDHLRTVVRALHGLAIPQQVISVNSDYVASGSGYELVDGVVTARLVALGDELLRLTRRLRPALEGSERETVVAARLPTPFASARGKEPVVNAREGGRR
jgi:azobenzene reductase